MKLTIDRKAVEWFKHEMDAKPGDAIRFFVRYGGSSPVSSSFSLGLSKEAPKDVGISANVDNILFFVVQDELEFFEGHDLVVTVDTMGELKFEFEK